MDIKLYFFLFLGLVLLLGSGKYLVESSVAIAKQFHIPTSIIGLTIVAFGTSAPELLVSIQAAVQGHPDMAIGNVIGSNISNILLVLAITTIIFPIAVKKSAVLGDWPIMLFVTLLLSFFLLDLEYSRMEGFITILFLLLYIASTVLRSRADNSTVDNSGSERAGSWKRSALIFILSCGGLAVGADLLVENASTLASRIGISERVISISMVALGTSLPELATSIIAAFKEETEISIGNILGSNNRDYLPF